MFFVKRKMTLEELLNQFAFPVIAVDSNTRALRLNEAGSRVLGRTADQTSGRLIGDVIECIHAATPEGCGRTIHCSACAIRRAVTATSGDGQPRRAVKAEQLVRTEQGLKLAHYTLSTEKAGGAVLVMIDDVKMLAADDALAAMAGANAANRAGV